MQSVFLFSEMKMETVDIKLTELKPYERNAKKHPESQVKAVAESIKQFGWAQPIVVDEDNEIIIGHGRLLAAKRLKLDTAPCYILKGLTPEQKRKLRLLDNKLNESEWDIELLKDEIPDLDFSGFPDIDWGIITPEEEKEVVEDEPPEVDEKNEPTAKLGDIWQLGEHRLMCGDSTDAAAIIKLMDGVKSDLVFTDPPYGMGKEAYGVLNDNLNYDDLLTFNKKWIPLSFDVLKENGSWYCWGIDEPLMDIYSNILKPLKKTNKITIRNYLTWAKESGQGQNSAEFRSYAIASEKCWFVMKGVQGFNTNSDNYYEAWEPIRSYLANEWRKISDKNDWDKYLGNQMGKHYFTKSQWALPTKEQYTKLQNIGYKKGAFKREYDEIKREYYKTRAYFNNTHDNMNDVWHFNKVNGKERQDTQGHATPKPIALCSRAIKSSSRESETVLDLFGGSGSTLIACEQLNRKCYMMELDPKYCDVIIKRWENLTGKTAIKIN